jgi:hypothetical protein
MTWRSTAPSALSAFTLLVQAAAVDSGTRILSRANVSAVADRDLVVIGFQSPDVPAVEGRFDEGGIAADPLRERYVIHNRIAASRGSTEILKAEARVFDLLAVIGGVLAHNPTLSDTVMLARLGNFSHTPAQTPRGALVVLQFDVEIDAFTTV